MSKEKRTSRVFRLIEKRFRAKASRMCECIALAVTLSLTGGCAPSELDDPQPDWGRWRGPNGQGVSTESGLPATWSEDSPNIRWKTWTPGAGNSSPIVSHGKVFITTAYGESEDDWVQTWEREKLHRVVLALDLKTGEILWQTSVLFGAKGKVHHTNTRATPSPATDGRLVFVNFDGYLVALDFDGAIAWKQDIDPDYYLHSHYGVSTSPILVGNKVILMQDREEGESEDLGWLGAFDSATGEPLWRKEWDHTCCSYTTPIVLERGGPAAEVVMSTSKEVWAFDSETGERLWTLEHETVQPIPSLVVSGDLLFVPGGIHDRDMVMYRLAGSGESTTAERLWESGRGVPEIPTPVFYEGKLYILLDNGALRAYDPETGQVLWGGRTSPGHYWPSLIAGDGKIYATNQHGMMSVVAAQDQGFHLVAENKVAEGTKGATPSIADGCILLRTQNHLYCIEDLDEPAPQT